MELLVNTALIARNARLPVERDRLSSDKWPPPRRLSSDSSGKDARPLERHESATRCLKLKRAFVFASVFSPHRRFPETPGDASTKVTRFQGWPRFGEDRSAKESQPTSSRTAEKRCGVIARFVSFAQVRFRIVRKLSSFAVEKQFRSEFDEEMS